METIKCPNCGALDKFYTELKANNNVARCTECDTFIKNIPYQTDQKFYFGKYNGKKVNEIEDLPYLEWVLKNVKPAETMRKAVQTQINRLNYLGK